jgi:hypothetical protein
VSISLVPHILAQNVPPYDEICNLIDPTNTDMEGNDYHTDEPNEMHQVLQQSFHLSTVCCFLVPHFIPSTLLYYNCIYIHVVTPRAWRLLLLAAP